MYILFSMYVCKNCNYDVPNQHDTKPTSFSFFLSSIITQFRIREIFFKSILCMYIKGYRNYRNLQITSKYMYNRRNTTIL